MKLYANNHEIFDIFNNVTQAQNFLKKSLGNFQILKQKFTIIKYTIYYTFIIIYFTIII